MTRYLETNETICATATPPGRGGIAVIRLSGPEAVSIGRKIAQFLPKESEIESHRAYYGVLRNSLNKESLDEAVVTYFAEGRSFTNQHVLEFSIHGSPAICELIIQSLIENGARLAEPGEFTYRAFSSGRIDLVQAESVLNLIESSTATMAKTSLRQLQGELSEKLIATEEALTFSLANLEANIDFAQEDIEIENAKATIERLAVVKKEIEKLVESYKVGKIISEGLHLSLVGAPNVGKSSLLNALVKYDRAIVSDIPGTTRDVVEASLALAGHIVKITDTAGVRETSDSIELLGVERTYRLIKDADVVGYVVDQSDLSTFDPGFLSDILKERRPSQVVLVLNKSDLPAHPELAKLAADLKLNTVKISTKNQSGIDELKSYIQQQFLTRADHSAAVLLNARHFELLSGALESVNAGISKLAENASTEFIILDIQQALMAIYEVLGKKFDDQVMDRVFSEFCLGK
ncbi:MAG: tRNA uridine-5-carboxymethylaminomethyl(34) synthesis GTPase MnmE [Bdellovibrionota bacterium]